MNDPIKIIFKYKNNNRKVQYNIYIFIGHVSNQILTVLKKIQNVSFYNSLTLLSTTEVGILVAQYGQYWYKKFFNTHHIDFTIKKIRESASTVQVELTKKFGKEWYEKHINKYELIDYKIIYTYENLIKYDLMKKKERKKKEIEIEFDDENDYKTYAKNLNNIDNSDLANHTIKQNGGGKEDNEIENKDEEIEDLTELEVDDTVIDDAIVDDEDFDPEDLEKIYQEEDEKDDNIDKTTTLIKKALNDEGIFDKKNLGIIEFDTTNDDKVYDEQLKSVYNKYYVQGQYIYKDDTIKSIRSKICSSIKNNNKFNENAFLSPSRQYLWSEYLFGNSVEKIMLGQKWFKRNELLNVDVEPNNNVHVYEELRGNLRLLRDNMKRYTNKIRMENDDNNILHDYESYYTNNEIYMIDIYNELGKNYAIDADMIKNLLDVYLKLYFPKIKSEDLKSIIDFLNTNIESEINKIQLTHATVTNDLILENEIMKTVDDVRTNKKYNYKRIFKDNYITQSNIHVNLRIKNNIKNDKIDLYRIFYNFTVNKQFPFIQYLTHDGEIVYKYDEKEINDFTIGSKDNSNILAKWFEYAPYGVSFKMKIMEKNNLKFLSISMKENGQIEYHTQWKEEDMATINDTINSYNYIRELIKKLNEENQKFQIEIPLDSEFKFAFMNTIQKFELDNNFIINHNDLSEFSRNFHPYISLVIEPRKRQSKHLKSDSNSKFGTYLRYKRISKYENPARIEQRILYFMRNYEYTDTTLGLEISKLFNITEERAIEEINKVRIKIPVIRKTRKILKKLENIPKYKPPGIGIDIQGKQREKYKIRISGARDHEQLDRIIDFMNILVFLYQETYLYKNPERQQLIEKLKKLTNIAKRRNKVAEFVDYKENINNVKQLISVDKRRIGFKPEEGQSQWTRACQNSGTDKRRQPHPFKSSNINKLIEMGYKFNKKSGMYEKKILVKGSGGKKEEIILKPIKMPEYDENGVLSGDDVYYICDPEINGEHFYVGFLTKSKNPHGECMPCCFKKDPIISKNKEKREFFKQCMGEIREVDKPDVKINTEKLYVLQDTNKIQDGRIGYLPKYLDFYFNYMLGNTNKITQHYLDQSVTGYYFKYGSKQDDFPFLNAVGSIVDLNVQSIITKIIDTLKNDKSNLIFTSLNNGDTKTQFVTREKFMDFILHTNFIDYDIISDLISLPNILTKNGFNIIIFHKKTYIVKKTLEKEKSKEDFNLLCNEDVISAIHNNPDKDSIILLKDGKNYYPIVMILKDPLSKIMEIKKLFKFTADSKNIINHLLPFIKNSCTDNFIDSIMHQNNLLTAKTTYEVLKKINNKLFFPKYQVIDERNKCKYFVTNNSTIIPVRPSGSIYNLTIVKSIDNYITGLEDTVKNLEELNKLTPDKLMIKPIGIYYDDLKNDKLNVTAVMTQTKDIVPVINQIVTKKYLESHKLVYENRPLYDKLDKEIIKGSTNFIIDDRIEQVKLKQYTTESYELFRLHFSDYINKPEHITFKNRLLKYISDPILSIEQKNKMIKGLLYKTIDHNLANLYMKQITADKTSDKIVNTIHNEQINQTGGKYEKFINIISKLPKLSNYTINNDRTVCNVIDKDKCNLNAHIHCHWSHSGCLLSITADLVIEFVNKITAEFLFNQLKMKEVFKENHYFVSDIVNYNMFKEKEGQKIIKSTAMNSKNLIELFGKDNLPKIGKRKLQKNEVQFEEINTQFALVDMGNMFLQKIIPNNLSILRAFINGYYWLNHVIYDHDNRNLGYYNQLQSDLANYFRSIIIDWLLDPKNEPIVINQICNLIDTSVVKNKISLIYDYIIRLGNTVTTFSDGVVELFVLSKIYSYNINIINDNNDPMYIFNDGIKFNYKEKPTNKKIDDKQDKKKSINIKYILNNNTVPDEIFSVYY